MKGSINSIESLGLFDGPGIRVIIFMNGCTLRCLYCHNPEMWTKQEDNISVDELVDKIKSYKPYFKNGGGVTFSGGEPLLQTSFLIEVCKMLKEQDIHIAIDTAGIAHGNYLELFNYVDLIILDIKHVFEDEYKKLTGDYIERSFLFQKDLNKLNKDIWIRQVIIPGINDNVEYVESLFEHIKDFKNVKKIEFLPYSLLGTEKYEKLNINYLLKDTPKMDKEKCNQLYTYLLNLYEKKSK